MIYYLDDQFISKKRNKKRAKNIKHIPAAENYHHYGFQ
jgi:hypothetical protein